MRGCLTLAGGRLGGEREEGGKGKIIFMKESLGAVEVFEEEISCSFISIIARALACRTYFPLFRNAPATHKNKLSQSAFFQINRSHQIPLPL